MVIKSHAPELGGYEESIITVLIYTHSRREIAHNFKFYL